MLLADFGAEVVKVEQPGTGDPLRQWTAEGQPLWWKVYARNKRFVTLNLKSPKGRDLLLRIAAAVRGPDGVVRARERWSGSDLRLGTSSAARHPELILLRISGWGQTGPDSARPGFGTLVEAASGFADMNGEPDGAPIVPTFPLADRVPALYASNAVMFALYHRDVHGGWRAGHRPVALRVPVFSPRPAAGGVHRRTAKCGAATAADRRNAGPRGCYRTGDGRWMAVSGSTPKMAERFLRSVRARITSSTIPGSRPTTHVSTHMPAS